MKVVNRFCEQPTQNTDLADQFKIIDATNRKKMKNYFNFQKMV